MHDEGFLLSVCVLLLESGKCSQFHSKIPPATRSNGKQNIQFQSKPDNNNADASKPFYV